MSDKLVNLPDCDHFEGVVLEKGPTPQASQVEIQYRSARTGWCSVKMPLLDALTLLNHLEAMSADHGYDKIRRPPGS